MTPRPDRDDPKEPVTRRDLLTNGLRGACLAGVAGLGGVLAARSFGDKPGKYVWQIDPAKCNACGNCATHCVLKTSAVKCVHAYAICGYCERCFGFFDPKAVTFDSAAEIQTCPSGAIKRASDVPPLVFSSGTTPQRSIRIARTTRRSGPSRVRNGSPPRCQRIS